MRLYNPRLNQVDWLDGFFYCTLSAMLQTLTALLHMHTVVVARTLPMLCGS
jgi:hypothetical protein